ncbi:MAG: hypothetical protein QM611_00945 [Microbacterium sp.]|uniref:hypothetical protein n=1 Tax=Microbacterium sp. TaxID=51671 RepID=UPI0039E719E2
MSGGTVHSPADVVGALADVLTWAGLGGAAVLGILCAIVALADGTWLPVRAVVEAVGDGHVVRWIDADGGVNEAPLSAHDHARAGGRDMVDVFYRRGWRNRMRLTRRSPLVQLLLRLAIGCAAVGLLALVGSWALLLATG